MGDMGGMGDGRDVLVKICGVTRPADAERAVELGADLVGLNFYPGSPRHLELSAAREVAAAVGKRALLVGVFVHAEESRVEEIVEAVGLDLVQLHGDEDPARVDRLGERALRVVRDGGGESTTDADGSGAALDPLGRPGWGFLFDLPADLDVGGDYGGTGTSWSWRLPEAVRGLDRPVLVAGGIRPDTARRALSVSGASGVDVCSGIESAPGIKDSPLMEQLFEEIRHGESPDPA